jgi:hypothetical protein
MRRLFRWATPKRVGTRVAVLAAVGLIGALMTAPGAMAALHATHAPSHSARSAAASQSGLGSCAGGHLLCTEVYDSEDVFGEGNYVGHDEPSLLFYSNQPGSGNRMRYQFTVPSDPSGPFSLSKSYNIQLRPAFWFGMAMCDTQSYPQQVSTCTPDSDSNITANLADHPGVAFMEMQFYPPGYVKQFTGFSCDPTKWCSALTIDSLSRDPVNGADLNPTCQSEILGGLEYVNFAYITKSGVPQGPPGPLTFDFNGSGDPGPDVLYYNQGDRVIVTMGDSAHGLRILIRDVTTGQTGFMTASAANGFGQIQAAPTGTSCTQIPYDFHPMYSTSSPSTRVTWAAHSYNVAFSDEIGHFDFCSETEGGGASCDPRALEGVAGDQEPTDGDDNYCFTPAESLLYPLKGCMDSNIGFDGTSYLPDWPDGSPNHPTSILFTSPKTGSKFNTPYQQAAFETDTARIEDPAFGGLCDRTTGSGCTLLPRTDDAGRPFVAFYPFYTANSTTSGCQWGIGNDLLTTTNDFGKTAQYGSLLGLEYLTFGGGGTTSIRYNDYQQVLGNVPC